MTTLPLLLLIVALSHSISRAWYPSDAAPQKLLLALCIVALLIQIYR